MKFALISLLITSSSLAFHAPLKPIRSKISLQVTAEDDRRCFLCNSVAAAASSLFLPLDGDDMLKPIKPVYADSVDYKSVSSDIMDLIKGDPDKGPTLVRLAWHSSGTYDKISKTGGSGGGTIRFKEELSHGGNAGLAVTAVQWLEPIHAKYYADLYTLAGGEFARVSLL